MAEIIVKYKEDTDRMKVKGGEYVQDLIRCKECKWRDHIGCALLIVDDSDKPKDNDFCSFGERKEDLQTDCAWK